MDTITLPKPPRVLVGVPGERGRPSGNRIDNASQAKQVSAPLDPETSKRVFDIDGKIEDEIEKLKVLVQDYARKKCLAKIRELRQEKSILIDGEEFVDDEDIDVFTLIELNAAQVGSGQSNSLIVTGDPGVGKTQTVLKAIAYLNPPPVPEVEESEEIDDENDSEDEDEDEESEGELNEDQGEDTEIEIPISTEHSKRFPAPPTPPKIPNIEAKTSRVMVNAPGKKGSKSTKLKVQKPQSSRNGVESGYYIASGTCTAPGLYELLFIHRHKLMVFDDFDSVLKDDECMNYLKAATDTYATRELSKTSKAAFNSFGMNDVQMWDEYEATGKVPNQFKFCGQIIFISNIHEDKFDSALISRSLHVDVRLSKQEIIERMHDLITDIKPEIDIFLKLEALNYLEFLTNKFECKFPLGLRELIHAINYRSANGLKTMEVNGKELLQWQQLIKKRMVKSKLKK